MRTPGQKAKPSNQDKIPVCSAHAVAKAVVDLLDYQGYNCDQNVITWILINQRVLFFKEVFPYVFDQLKLALEIENTGTKEKSQLRIGDTYLILFNLFKNITQI